MVKKGSFIVNKHCRRTGRTYASSNLFQILSRTAIEDNLRSFIFLCLCGNSIFFQPGVPPMSRRRSFVYLRML